MMMKILSIAIILLLSIQIATAKTYDSCYDNSTKLTIKEVQIEVKEKNITRTFNVTEYKDCFWGCRNNECVNPPWITWAIIFGIVILIVILYMIFRPV
jgi:hypothetical protein